MQSSVICVWEKKVNGHEVAQIGTQVESMVDAKTLHAQHHHKYAGGQHKKKESTSTTKCNVTRKRMEQADDLPRRPSQLLALV